MPKFLVSYERQMSTVGQEIKTTGRVVIELDNRPSRRKGFGEVEKILKERFLATHRGHLKNLLAVSFKIQKASRM